MLSGMHEPSLRDQLIEAKRNLGRQLAILEGPATVAGKPGMRPPDNRSLIASLQAQLREIDDALANLKDDNA